jgi:hypothetical protein
MMQNCFSMSKLRARVQFERKAIDKSGNCKGEGAKSPGMRGNVFTKLSIENSSAYTEVPQWLKRVMAFLKLA